MIVSITVACKNTPEEIEEFETIEPETTFTETIVEATPEVPEEKEPEFVEYTVKEGDTLAQIAERFLWL